MKKSLLIVIISLLVGMVCMVSVVIVSPAYGSVLTTLYVDPSNIIDTTKTVGTNVTININVKDATDLFSYNFFLNYATHVLTATNITLGSFFPPDSVIWHNETNDDSGYVWYGVTMPLGSQVGVTGSGTLATINFTVDSTGESPLDLCIEEIQAKNIQDSWPVDIDYNEYDGYFSNILRHTRLYVDPENIINPNLDPSENFTINVKILNATDLFGYEFFLNYTTDVLTATEIMLGSFFPPDSVIVKREINDTIGYAWYDIAMPLGAPSGKTGSGTLATINFTVDSTGESPLDLCNTKLVDSEGERIEHDTFDGYFSNKPIIHDIAITDVTTTVTTVKVIDNIPFPESKNVDGVHVGEEINITVYVKNDGTRPETFDVTAYYDNNSISTKNVVALSEGFSETLTFEWSTEGVPIGNYTIWAEASVVEGEENTANNKFTMETEFAVLPKQSFPIELAVGAIVLIIAAAGIAVYFIKIRKPKPA